MTFDQEVLAALRNATDIALYVEAVPDTTWCPNATVIRALNLCALGTVLASALAEAWAVDHPADTPASQILQAAHDRYACNVIEANSF